MYQSTYPLSLRIRKLPILTKYVLAKPAAPSKIRNSNLKGRGEDRAETMHACALGARKSKDGIQQVTLSKF